MAWVLFLVAIFSSASASSYILSLKEGDICKDGSPPSYCKLQADCPGLAKALKDHQFPKICSFKTQREPIICCPPSLAEDKPSQNNHLSKRSTSDTAADSKTSKAHEKCKEYAKYVWKKGPSLTNQEETKVDSCGKPSSLLIHNGYNAALPREFPHMVFLGYGEEDNIQWSCLGNLISERYIVSVAHCADPGRSIGPAKWAKLGELDTSKDDEDAQPVTIKITERIVHPNYSTGKYYNDIALYKLEKDAPLGIYIRPICLNTEKTITETRFLASSWGATELGGPQHKEMIKLNLDIVPHKQCNETYQSLSGSRSLPEGISPDYMICAKPVSKYDLCQGSSGAPIQIPLDNPYCSYSLVGIASFGKGCGAEFPGVFTNIAHYVKWIENIIWP